MCLMKCQGIRNNLATLVLGSSTTDSQPNSNHEDCIGLKKRKNWSWELTKMLQVKHKTEDDTLRFEVDMVAYSLCEFGDGEVEKTDLQAYREYHFPLLMQRLKKSKLISVEELRSFRKMSINSR